MAVDFFLHSVELIGQSLARVLALHGQDVFEGLLLAAQDLHLLFVSIQVLMKLAARFRQTLKFALQMGGVFWTLHLAGCCLPWHYVRITLLQQRHLFDAFKFLQAYLQIHLRQNEEWSKNELTLFTYFCFQRFALW